MILPNVGRILIRSVNWLGDAIMTTPALLRLKQTYPTARITLLAPEKLGELWWNHPAVDEVLEFSSTDGPLKIGWELRSRHFDLGIAFPNSLRSALDIFFARARVRVGYTGNARSLFLTRAVSRPLSEFKMRKRSVDEVRRLAQLGLQQQTIIPESAHQLYHYLNLISSVGCDPTPLEPSLSIARGEVIQFKQKFLSQTDGRDQREWIGINPGAEYGPAKRWPAARFVDAICQLALLRPYGFILFGGTSDSTLTQEIQRLCLEKNRALTLVELAGRTTLRELAAGMKYCNVVLTNDTGPMHLAAAVGTPVVVPFGSTSPELTGPGLPNAARHEFVRVPVGCAPCFLRECPIDFRCMTGIRVERVVEAVARLAMARTEASVTSP